MANDPHPFLPSGWSELPDPYRAAEARVSAAAESRRFASMGGQTTLEARLRQVENMASRTRAMVDGATIECSGGGVTLTWGAD
jgi:hypothetical protein